MTLFSCDVTVRAVGGTCALEERHFLSNNAFAGDNGVATCNERANQTTQEMRSLSNGSSSSTSSSSDSDSSDNTFIENSDDLSKIQYIPNCQLTAINSLY
ncbi:unnamed protein product [Arctia plantaginis]|uniref:Uncharacterized protein n=1 Tax=Arctia plantaginis TaxID=874455 RepID=A0A8S1A1K9_ARCPL|nr:unnamed protein product [Arctia plantaginis]CAB3260024.1 unnamed protein product [Arctia plantaginis]